MILANISFKSGQLEIACNDEGFDLMAGLRQDSVPLSKDEFDSQLFHLQLIHPTWSDDSANYFRHSILPAPARGNHVVNNVTTLQIRYAFVVEALPRDQHQSEKDVKEGRFQAQIRAAALSLQRCHVITPYYHKLWNDRLRLDLEEKGSLPPLRPTFAVGKFAEGRHIYDELTWPYQDRRHEDMDLLDAIIWTHVAKDILEHEPVDAHEAPFVRGRLFPEANHFLAQFELILKEDTDMSRCAKDFQDLFSTLMVSLPLTPHRVRFQRVDHTFSSEEAINNLGSLKFSQSNRMPDPKDPSRIVTTTTTTTFSMAREMARSVCQRFMDARFIESADGKMVSTFPLKNGVWQLTPKGMHVLQRFCQRNGINQRHVVDLLESPRNSMQLVILERDVRTDKLSHDKATIEVIFRRFVGQDGPNVKPSTSTADSDSLSDYGNGLVGVKMAKERRVADKTVFNTFTGKATVEWLTDCCCTVDRHETCEIGAEFVQQGLMKAVLEDKAYLQHHPQERDFQPTKVAIYGLTEKGQRVAGWILRDRSNGSDGANGTRADPRAPSTRDSNTNRLTVILSDPALRLLFREFLRDTHCEENLAFYLDVVEFTSTYRAISRKNAAPEISTIRESLAAAYGKPSLPRYLTLLTSAGLYNAFLAPGSPCELNIDHNLRNNLAGRMTRAVGDDEAMINSLKDVAKLFDEAQNSVFKLMSSVRTHSKFEIQS